MDLFVTRPGKPADCDFSDRIPPRFDSHVDYASYCKDVTLFTNLTTVPANRHKPAVMYYLHSKGKTAANKFSAQVIFHENGINLILQQLEKEYAIGKTNQVEADLADSLGYSWKKEYMFKHLITGFHT